VDSRRRRPKIESFLKNALAKEAARYEWSVRIGDIGI
jgi:hypothetical protein